MSPSAAGPDPRVRAFLEEGMAYHRAGDHKGAAAAFERALALSPTDKNALLALGVVHMETGGSVRAAEHFDRAIALYPASPEALFRRAEVEFHRFDSVAALPFLERAMALSPNNERFVRLAAPIYSRVGRFAESRTCYQAFLKGGTSNDWSNYLRELNYDPALSPQAIFDEHRKFQALFPAAQAPVLDWSKSRGTRKLRVGYVSADFRYHAAASFLLPTLQAHDRDRIEVFCYAQNVKSDAVTERFQALAPAWRSIARLSDGDAAALVTADKIDILVDCAGHTTDQRLGIFARRPAPHSVTFLGYPNTTGLAVIDCRITDGISDPAGEGNAFASEKLMRLPRGFHAYAPFADLPPVPPPCLANKFVTFGSFNARVKMNETVLAAWSQILKAIPGSRLLLKDLLLRGQSAAQVRDLMARHGIAADRIETRTYTDTMAGHYAMYGDMDIALDTFPYNGTTTTCDALWMGVPVVALRGDRHAARVSASLLTRMGTPEFIAEDVSAYVRVAAALAADTDRLARLRQSLRGMVQSSPLGNASTIARDLEDFYFSIMDGTISTT